MKKQIFKAFILIFAFMRESPLRKPKNLSLSAIFFATNLKILCPILIFAFCENTLCASLKIPHSLQFFCDKYISSFPGGGADDGNLPFTYS